MPAPEEDGRVSTLVELHAELGRRGLPARSLQDGELSMAVEHGAWRGRLSMAWSARSAWAADALELAVSGGI